MKDVSMLIWLEWLLSKNLANEIEFKNLIKGKPILYIAWHVFSANTVDRPTPAEIFKAKYERLEAEGRAQG